jgi:hypothetical protein
MTFSKHRSEDVMNIFKAFASIPAEVNNLPGQVATFGELSPRSKTFTRLPTLYSAPTNPGFELVGFHAKSDAGIAFTPTGTLTQHQLDVVSWILNAHNTGSIPANSSKAAFILAIETQFPTITNVEINEILNGTPITSRFPDFVKWRFSDSGTEYETTIWFADSRFQSQYDQYEILLIPPITPIDNLNASTSVVTDLIQAVEPSDILAQATTLAGIYPYTGLVTHNVIWNNPVAPHNTLNTTWYVLGYGPLAFDVDNIKNAIREYITTHTALPPGTWNVIYAGLYAENEFVLIPLWGDMAIPVDGLGVAIYDAIVRTGNLRTIATNHLPSSYADSVTLSSYLAANLEIIASYWRSIMMVGVGNPNNVDANTRLSMLYPDYASIQHSSADWMRMSAGTRDFVSQLVAGLEVALTMTSTSGIPVGFGRATRDGKVYTTFTYSGYTYFILTAASYS